METLKYYHIWAVTRAVTSYPQATFGAITRNGVFVTLYRATSKALFIAPLKALKSFKGLKEISLKKKNFKESFFKESGL